jgi:hypothetical protein
MQVSSMQVNFFRMNETKRSELARTNREKCGRQEHSPKNARRMQESIIAISVTTKKLQRNMLSVQHKGS